MGWLGYLMKLHSENGQSWSHRKVDWAGCPRGLLHPRCSPSSVSSTWPLPTVKLPGHLTWRSWHQNQEAETSRTLSVRPKANTVSLPPYSMIQNYHQPTHVPGSGGTDASSPWGRGPCLQEGSNWWQPSLRQATTKQEERIVWNRRNSLCPDCWERPRPTALGWPSYYSSKVKFEQILLFKISEVGLISPYHP